MKQMFIILSLCALGCSTSGNSGQPGQQPPGLAGLFAQTVPAPAQQEPSPTSAPIPSMQPMQPVQPVQPADPDPDQFAQAEPPPVPAEMAPAMPAPAMPAPAMPAPAMPAPAMPAEMAPAETAPAEMAPVQRAQPADQGNAGVCSAMCDRVASCGIATKQACMPVCTPQIPALTPEQRAQLISMMGSMSCDDLTQFGRQGSAEQGAEAPGRGQDAD
jgi:hypothetical protein